MYCIIRCYTCNNSLGEYVDIYELLKNYIYQIELKKKYNDSNPLPNQIPLDSVMDIKLNEIFDFLKIERYCCRRVLITNVNYDSLLYSSMNN